VSVDDLEKTEDPSIHSSRSANPRIQSSPSADLPLSTNRSALSTGRGSSAVTKDVINYLEKVDVDTKLGDIDQVLICYTTTRAYYYYDYYYYYYCYYYYKS